MSVEIYKNFKSYNQYRFQEKPKKRQHLKINPLPLAGSALGVLAGRKISPKLTNHISSNGTKEVVSMLSMAYLADIGGVIGGSIGKNKNQIKKKIHEAGFQMMNTTIPMLMVNAAIAICDNVKCLKNNKIVKVLGCVGAMASGAMIATKITNSLQKENTPKRKYTIKDTLANVDDVAATLIVGFGEVPQLLTINKFAKSSLPFIYAYSGYRAGNKE